MDVGFFSVPRLRVKRRETMDGRLAFRLPSTTMAKLAILASEEVPPMRPSELARALVEGYVDAKFAKGVK